MIDEHIIPDNWGIRPVLFRVFGINVESYAFFVTLALIVGFTFYFLNAKQKKKLNENTFFLAVAALVGGALGAKLPIWIYHFKDLIVSGNVSLFLSGRTVIGGIIGGFVAVKLTKWKLGIKQRMGNQFVPAIWLGIFVGRIGCFLRGCCYGVETRLPWGVNYGDGLLRHPTQLYESLFAFSMFILSLKFSSKFKEEGRFFDMFLLTYFSFRFMLEFIRMHTRVFLGLTMFQIVCLVVICYVLVKWKFGKVYIHKKK